MLPKLKLTILLLIFPLIMLIVMPVNAKTPNAESAINGPTWGFRNSFLTGSGTIEHLTIGTNPDYYSYGRGFTRGSRISSNGTFTPAQVRVKVASFETSSLVPGACSVRDTGWVTGIGSVQASTSPVSVGGCGGNGGTYHRYYDTGNHWVDGVYGYTPIGG